MVAAELVDQLTQHSIAESDLYEQIRKLDGAKKKGPPEVPPKEEVDRDVINSILHIRARWIAAHLSPSHGGTLPW
jgi:hypothetical protein